MRTIGCGCAVVIVISALLVGAEREASSDLAKSGFALNGPTRAHEERLRDPWMPRPVVPPPGVVSRSAPVVRGPYTSIQVNVDEFGNNIPGDAANEPSIAIDPTNPNKIVIGWRQFDSVESDFRQAGWAYSHDAGETWTFPDVLEPGVFRSDPVLDADADGNIYFYSLTDDFTCDLFKSIDGGVSWLTPVPAFGGDKPWMAIDRTNGIGRGNIYAIWSSGPPASCGVGFTRSTDGGATFMDPTGFSGRWGTMSVGANGTLFAAGWCSFPDRLLVRRSTNAQDGNVTPVFETPVAVYLGGSLPRITNCYPNPGGLCGQVWVATDHSDGPTRGNVYLLASVAALNGSLEVMFARSANGGLTWSDPVRVNDYGPGSQWFGTMSVAPNGRVDVVWNDGRNAAGVHLYELFYAFSMDGGRTWSENVPVSPVFDSWVGWPQQNKIGDYYDMISDNGGANVAYAATFNGEQDVYFLRIPRDCNDNGIEDPMDITNGTSSDCNGNDVPDECEPDEDCNSNGIQDICDIGTGTSADCDRNRIPDECEPDCNSNNVHDICDIADGTSHDRNGNSVPDECESGILLVNALATGLNNGSSWADAYNHLQDALAAAKASNGVIREIWVARGTYRPDQGANQTPGDRTTTFQLLSGVAIYGGFADGETTLEQRNLRVNTTILSGDLNGDDPDTNCCLIHVAPGCDDAECESAVCQVFDFCCDFEWDDFCVSLGASICGLCPGDNLENSNHVVTGTGTDATAVLDGFKVTAGNARDASSNSGGGLFIASGHTIVNNCTFVGNTAFDKGGALYVEGGTPTLTNCMFVGNSAFDGGAMFVLVGGLRATNCTVVANDAVFVGGMWGGRDSVLRNCIFWGNVDQENEGQTEQIGFGTPVINHSCIQGWTGELGGISNIGDDPLFVDPGGLDGIPGTLDDNLRLVPASPAINAGDPDFVPGSGGTDLDGHARVLCGRVDMGAYEFGIGDFDCNSNNDLIDFVNWSGCMTGPAGGPYAESCEAFDFDFDGDVDVKDFHGFQTAYGPCPDPPNDDIDGDGICRNTDNCPNDVNVGQKDTDGDGVGDVCDTCTDTDGDGFGDPGFPVNTCPDDTCPGFDDNVDADGDGIPDGCDPCPTPDTDDADGDAICDNVDNCPNYSNSDQADCNRDGAGNVCEIAECPGDDPACSDCNDNGVPDACELVPVGYKNTNHSGDFFTPGALVLFADDIRLVPTECNMIAYEFAHKGNGIIQVDFRTFLDNNDPNDGGVIPDTRNVCFSSGSDVQICRASRSTPIPLPQDFFVVFKTSSDAVGPIATCQQASVGSTEDSYAFHDGKAWVFEDIGDSCHAGFDIRIECASIPDCNGNSIPDECDLAAMTSEDCNANGIPDECALGDIDGNQAIDILDYAGFNACFTGPCGNQPCDPPLDIGSCCQIVDFDGDDDVDLKDVRGFQRVFAP